MVIVSQAGGRFLSKQRSLLKQEGKVGKDYIHTIENYAAIKCIYRELSTEPDVFRQMLRGKGKIKIISVQPA